MFLRFQHFFVSNCFFISVVISNIVIATDEREKPSALESWVPISSEYKSQLSHEQFRRVEAYEDYCAHNFDNKNNNQKLSFALKGHSTGNVSFATCHMTDIMRAGLTATYVSIDNISLRALVDLYIYLVGQLTGHYCRIFLCRGFNACHLTITFFETYYICIEQSCDKVQSTARRDISNGCMLLSNQYKVFSPSLHLKNYL